MMTHEPLIKQPLSVGGFLDLWFSLYKRFFFKGVGLVLLFSLTKLLLLPLFLIDSVGPVARVLIDLVLSAVIFVFNTIIFLKLISQACLGEPQDWKIAITTAKKCFWGYIKSRILVSLWLGLCYLCLIIPFFFAFMNRFLVPEIMIFEGISFKESWRRSKFLTYGTRKRIMLFYLFPIFGQMIVTFSVIFSLAYFKFDISKMDYYSNPLQIFFNMLIPLIQYAVFFPATLIFYTLYYYDCRVRKEALDLELESRIIPLTPVQA